MLNIWVKGKQEIEFDSNFGAYGTIDEKKETYVKKINSANCPFLKN